MHFNCYILLMAWKSAMLSTVCRSIEWQREIKIKIKSYVSNATIETKKSDIHDRLPCFMAMPISMYLCCRLLTVPIYTANRSTCLRTVRFYSLLFTYDFFARLAIRSSFFFCLPYRFLWPMSSLFPRAETLPYLALGTWILFTLQLGPNNPNKWTNWEITSTWIEQWKLISHLKWGWQLQLPFYSRMQSSPSFIWASMPLWSVCVQCAPFLLLSCSACIVIQLFNYFRHIRCCLHFEFTVW